MSKNVECIALFSIITLANIFGDIDLKAHRENQCLLALAVSVSVSVVGLWNFIDFNVCD